MPFHYFVGIIWAILVISSGMVGKQRGLERSLVVAIQSVFTILALAGMIPTLGLFGSVLALIGLLLFLAVSAFARRFDLAMPIPYTAGVLAVFLAFFGAETPNTMLLRSLGLLALAVFFLLGFNLGFRYLFRRLVSIPLVLFGVSLITFGLMHSVPGGPFDAGGETGGIPLTPEVRANLMRKYNLDRPLPIQYISWVGNVVRGDFGFSFQRQNQTCQEIIADAWPVSVHLGAMTFVIVIFGGMALGMSASVNQNTWKDQSATIVAVLCIALPSFIAAIGLILLFSLGLHWFETGGWSTPSHWVMPVIAMAATPLAVIARFTRSNMIETIRSDFVRTARAKGLTELSVIVVHVLKNALIPLLTVGGPMAANLITGSFFIETIFRIPGIGRYFTTSVFARDYPMIMATTMLWSTLIVVIYRLTDLLYAWADPRIRYRSS
ncbi:MAG: ABC transporter permease [Candidatus Latescibacteria bacterium]|jgi:peptide/nickel transport system permease protein|nr:ABC transporter permease [Candidatus Latescibacterota bacterium]